jgi:hypothetical protein
MSSCQAKKPNRSSKKYNGGFRKNETFFFSINLIDRFRTNLFNKKNKLQDHLLHNGEEFAPCGYCEKTGHFRYDSHGVMSCPKERHDFITESMEDQANDPYQQCIDSDPEDSNPEDSSSEYSSLGD